MENWLGGGGGNIKELRDNVNASIASPIIQETRRKWGGIFKQALATVESHFEEALEMGKALPLSLPPSIPAPNHRDANNHLESIIEREGGNLDGGEQSIIKVSPLQNNCITIDDCEPVVMGTLQTQSQAQAQVQVQNDESIIRHVKQLQKSLGVAEGKVQIAESALTRAIQPLQVYNDELVQRIVKLEKELENAQLGALKLEDEHQGFPPLNLMKESNHNQHTQIFNLKNSLEREICLLKEQTDNTKIHYEELIAQLERRIKDLTEKKPRPTSILSHLPTPAVTMPTPAIMTTTSVETEDQQPPPPPIILNNLEYTYWELQRQGLIKSICQLKDENDQLERKLSNPESFQGKLAQLEVQYELALQTIGEQQDQILCLASDLKDLRQLYHHHIQLLQSNATPIEKV